MVGARDLVKRRRAIQVNTLRGSRESSPKWRTRFLKRHVTPSDKHDFIGRIFDLGIVSLSLDPGEESQYSDAKYALAVNDSLSALVQRVESLNLVGNLLWPDMSKDAWDVLPVSRYEWLVLTTDVFLMRYVSVIDCACLLVNDVYECSIPLRKCSPVTLGKARVPNRVLEALAAIEMEQRDIRNERNIRIHRGKERGFSSDDTTFRTAAIFEGGSHSVRGSDYFGRKINVERFFREGLVELQRDFNLVTRKLVRRLNQLYGSLHIDFNQRFHEKFRQPNSFGSLQHKDRR